MSNLPPVLHRSARAITPHEFLDALQATCAPRFPGARGRTHRPIALAISGGVDSMALAYLCTQIRPTDYWFKVADHPVSRPIGLVVDHGMRQGSADEARNVADVLGTLGMKQQVLKISWSDVTPADTNPSDLPNVETLARQLRYRRLGAYCKMWHIPAFMTAHHEDDQYETVLMRLLSGHGLRGLQGMRPATDIPECYDMHGVYQSGFIDDQRHRRPCYNMRPSQKEKKLLKRDLRSDVKTDVYLKEIEEGLKADVGSVANAYLDDYDGIAKGGKRGPRLIPLDLENGGVMVYRPLLRFSKDRLIATCLENRIPWFEDHTNADPTLTMRNAVRYIHKNHNLPVALQKPSILRLSERCRAKVASAEAEAGRLLSHVLMHEFGPNAGTLVVTLPRFQLPTVPSRSSTSPARRRKRAEHYRHIAALLVRRLLSMVTPERELSQVGQLSHLVSMLFPSLADDGAAPPEPKPYVICGVHFIPLIGDYPLRWLLTRAPHVSNAPRPSVTFNGLPLANRLDKHPSAWEAKSWTQTKMFDGRYWIRLLHRLPCKLHVAPFEPEHHKPFREALADDQARKELASALRRYAPAKTRYTLPAIYAAVDVSDLIAGGDWWPPHPSSSSTTTSSQPPQPEGAAQSTIATAPATPTAVEPTETSSQKPKITNDKAEINHALDDLHHSRLDWENKTIRETAAAKTPQLQLLALPTLGVALPGLDSWLRWEVRYRKVDDELLRLRKLGAQRLDRREFRRRVRCLWRWVSLGRGGGGGGGGGVGGFKRRR